MWKRRKNNSSIIFEKCLYKKSGKKMMKKRKYEWSKQWNMWLLFNNCVQQFQNDPNEEAEIRMKMQKIKQPSTWSSYDCWLLLFFFLFCYVSFSNRPYHIEIKNYWHKIPYNILCSFFFFFFPSKLPEWWRWKYNANVT